LAPVLFQLPIKIQPLPDPLSLENTVDDVFKTTTNHYATTDYEVSFAADAYVLVTNRSRDDYFKVQMKDVVGYISPTHIKVPDATGRVSTQARYYRQFASSSSKMLPSLLHVAVDSVARCDLPTT